MKFTKKAKDTIKQEILQSLKPEKEVKKIIIFGSFLESENPNDIDVAIFQDSEESYLPLAMKYRRLIRGIARRIPIDIIPIQRIYYTIVIHPPVGNLFQFPLT